MEKTSSWLFMAVIALLVAVVGCGRDTAPTPVPPPAVTAFPVGSGPSGLAFDGESLWVTNQGENTVTRLRRDGGVVGVYPVGKSPAAVAYGGGYVWVANSGDGTVTKLTLSGQPVGTIRAGTEPVALAYWESALWVVNYGDSSVVKLSRDGEVLAKVPVGKHPRALAFTGSHLWVASQGDGTVTTLNKEAAMVASIRASGSPSPTVFGDKETGPAAIAFDGTFVWLAYPEVNALTQMDENGMTLAYYPLPGQPLALVVGGGSLWATNTQEDAVTRLDLKRIPEPTVTVSVGQRPVALTYDGASVWVANRGDNTVARLDPR